MTYTATFQVNIRGFQVINAESEHEALERVEKTLRASIERNEALVYLGLAVAQGNYTNDGLKILEEARVAPKVLRKVERPA